ncbi:unnamed protein product [Rotaria socialis]|nr:unnamed protein product [Rotaria socialis]
MPDEIYYASEQISIPLELPDVLLQFCKNKFFKKTNIYNKGKYEWKFSGQTNGSRIRMYLNRLQLKRAASFVKLFVTIANGSYLIPSIFNRSKRMFVLKRNSST